MPENDKPQPQEQSLRDRITQELDNPELQGWPRWLVTAAGVIAVDSFIYGLNVVERVGASAVAGVVIYLGLGKYIRHRESGSDTQEDNITE